MKNKYFFLGLMVMSFFISSDIFGCDFDPKSVVYSPKQSDVDSGHNAYELVLWSDKGFQTRNFTGLQYHNACDYLKLRETDPAHYAEIMRNNAANPPTTYHARLVDPSYLSWSMQLRILAARLTLQ